MYKFVSISGCDSDNPILMIENKTNEYVKPPSIFPEGYSTGWEPMLYIVYLI